MARPAAREGSPANDQALAELDALGDAHLSQEFTAWATAVAAEASAGQR